MNKLQAKAKILVLIILIFSGTLISCTKIEEIPIEDYNNYLRKTEYERIYTMLSEDSRDVITLDELVTRYTNIYDAISISSMTYDLVSTDYEDDYCYAVFNLNIVSDKLGEFQLTMDITFVKEEKEWKIVWDTSLLLPGLDEDDVVRITSIDAERGEIFASDGSLLAENAVATTVYVNIDKIQNDETLIRVVAPILEMEESEIRELLEPYYEKLEEAEEDTNDDTTEDYSTSATLVILKAYPIDDGLTSAQEEALLEVDGIGIDNDYMTTYRYYPNGSVLSHIIGYVGVLTEEEAELSENANLPADSMIGKSGLEKEYEMELRAEPGYKLTINDEYGHEKEVVVYKEGVDGADLRLNIDLELQIKTELLLMETLTSDMSGAVVILDPSDGSILSIASYPTYDPNLFAFSISEEDWAELNDEENRNPLYNRATQGLYPPGSTFKPFTAAMALDTETISKSFVLDVDIDDNVWVPDDPEWVYSGITRSSSTPGDLNMKNAITYSDNIYFAYVAMEIGRDTFYEYCETYGMNEAVPFDLSVASATISNTDSIEDIKQLADSGYGQGELLVTPLQMACLFSAFANDGSVMVPRLISSINEEVDNQYNAVEAFDAEIWLEDIISAYSIDTITPYLRRVIEYGTGTQAYISGLTTYGKTGTAEIGTDESREIAWFIGYTLGTDARVVCVMIEVPTGENDVKFTIAKELFQ